MVLRRITFGLMVLALPLSPVRASSPSTVSATAPSSTAGISLFADHVRPVLIDQCIRCHGGEKIKGDLDMTTREGLLHPGENGPAIVPGKSAESRLMKLIWHADKPYMPEKKPKLSDESIEYVARWIDAGAPYDKPLIAKSAIAKGRAVVTLEDKKFWAFAPLKHPAPPAVKDEKWCRTPIDRFILAALARKGIAPNREAEKRKLIRRA